MDPKSMVSDATVEEDRKAARAEADGGPVPTKDEEAAAERADYDPEAGRNEAEYNKMAANHPGEGRIEG